MQDLPNWPVDLYCRSMRVYKQYLIAMGLTDQAAGETYPTTLRWSHPADPGSVPTSWDIADATKDAGEVSLSETPGWILDGLPLGNAFMVYKTDSTYHLEYTGGQFIHKLDKRFASLGILADNCMTEFFHKHFVLTRGDVVVHDGVRIDSVISARMKRRLFALMDADYYRQTIVVKHAQRKEMWICIPTDSSNGDLEHAFIWNWEDDTWTERELPNLASAGAGTIKPPNANNSIDSLPGTIDSLTGPIDRTSFEPSDETLVLGTSTKLLEVDTGNTFDGTVFTASLERTGLTVAGQSISGELILDPSLVKYCRAVYPQVSGDLGAQLQIKMGFQNSFEEPVTWGPSQTYTIGTDIKVDVDVAGKLLAINISSATDATWELSGYGLDLDIVGKF